MPGGHSRLQKEWCSTEFGSEVKFKIQNHLYVMGTKQSEQTPAIYNHCNQVGSYQLNITNLEVDDSDPKPQLQIHTRILGA